MSGGAGLQPLSLDLRVPSAADDRLAYGLALALGLCDEQPAPPAGEVRSAEASGEAWPAGPGGLDAQAVGRLVERLLADPAIVAAAPPGVTKRRLASLLPIEARPAAGAVLEWLDAAGVLAEPSAEQVRWREPRPLRSGDAAWVAAQLWRSR